MGLRGVELQTECKELSAKGDASEIGYDQVRHVRSCTGTIRRTVCWTVCVRRCSAGGSVQDSGVYSVEDIVHDSV